MTVGIIGLGLMGGSLAKAITFGTEHTVWGTNRSPEPVKKALFAGAIQKELKKEDLSACDLVIVSLYPEATVNYIKENASLFKKGAIVMDVSGVKRYVCDALYDTARENDFVFLGAHPMAGRELSGVEYATKDIFNGANYIVTPTAKNTPEAIDFCKKLGYEMGFNTVSELSPEEHDEMIGFLSQLAHCIAVSLMVCKDSRRLVDYTGDSFRDLTRIAKINDLMWSELFLLNKEQLLAQMDLFMEKFTQLRDDIARDDTEAIREMMRLSKQRREYFDIKEEKK